MKISTRHIQTLRYLLALLVVLILGWYTYSHRGEFAILARVSWKHILLLAGAIIFNGFVSAAQSASLFKSIGAPIGILESFGLSCVGGVVGLVLPQGTTLTKMIYLNQRYAIPLPQTPVIFLGLLIVFLLIGALILTLNNLVAVMLGIPVPLIMWLSSALGITSALLFLIDIPDKLFLRWGRIGQALRQFSDSWTSLRRNQRCLLEASILQVFMFASSGLINYIAYQSVGLEINLLTSISLAVFVSFLNLIMITPSNLGIQESAYGYITQLSGMLFLEGVVVSTLIRAVSLGSTLVLAPIMWYSLFMRRGIRISLDRMPVVKTQTTEGEKNNILKKHGESPYVHH